MVKAQQKKIETEEEKNKQIYDMVNDLVKKSHAALDQMANFTQEQVDKICEAVATAGEQNAYPLAKMAVEETGRGIVEDKTTKNMYASENIWNSLRHEKTVGIIDEDKEQGLVKIAEPKGVIAGVTPVTNPTSTVIFKAMLALKTRNTIIFGFHPQAQKCCVETGKIIRAAAEAAGAPKNAIQWIEEPSLQATSDLMTNPGVQTILATGGPGMVKAAYSSGKPAIGVGPGNGPSYIEKTANIDRAVYDIVLSKTFDNGMVCASENSVVADHEIYDQVKEEFKKWNCYFLNKDEIKKDTITLLRSAILQVEKDNQKQLSEDEMLAIVSKEVKKRKESIADYEKANREDIVQKLKKEIEILSEYLPEQLSEEEIIKIVEEAINETGATSPRDMGKVMQAIRPKTNGKADGKVVSQIVREKLENM